MKITAFQDNPFVEKGNSASKKDLAEICVQNYFT
jgi:hypothetical protein